MITQIYSIQTAEEALACIEADGAIILNDTSLKACSVSSVANKENALTAAALVHEKDMPPHSGRSQYIWRCYARQCHYVVFHNTP